MAPAYHAPAPVSWLEVAGDAAPGERVRHRGLDNPAQAHHCFLNVCIQALWHLGAFRRRLLAASELPPSAKVASHASLAMGVSPGPDTKHHFLVPVSVRVKTYHFRVGLSNLS